MKFILFFPVCSHKFRSLPKTQTKTAFTSRTPPWPNNLNRHIMGIHSRHLKKAQHPWNTQFETK